MACRNSDGNSGFSEYYKTSSGTSYLGAGIPPVGGGGWITENANYPVTLSLNNWHMVTYTVSNTGYSIYVDGQPGTSVAWGASPEFSPSGCDLQIGGRSGYINSNVWVDDLQLYGSVLTAAQIQQLYNTDLVQMNGGLPTTTPVQLASGTKLDLNGLNQTVDSLADGAGGGGTVTTSVSNATYGVATLTLAPAGATTFSGAIQDGACPIALVLNGAGTQVLAGSNTYTGGTTIINGTLQLGDGASRNGSVAGGITDNAQLVFANPNAQTYAGAIGGSGGMTKTATGTLVLTGASTYTGGTTISDGTLQLGDGVASNGSVAGGIENDARLTFANPNAQTCAGAISGSGSLTKTATGTLVLTGGNSYSGGTTVSNGTLQMGNATALGSDSADAIISKGVLDLHGYNVSVDALSGTGTIDNLAGSGTYTLTAGNGGASSTFSGVIRNTSGAIALVKADMGMLVLAGTDTYTGGTEASSGTLDFATPKATPSVGVITFDVGGYVALGRLLGASPPAIETSATDATETGANTSGTSGTVAATSTVSETTATLGGAAAGWTGSAAIAAGAAAVPEPGTAVLLAAAAAGLAIAARRRKRTAR